MARILVHELRHYITYKRQVRALTNRGMNPRTASIYMGRLETNHPKAFALLIEQMEREAKLAERTFVPGVLEQRISSFLYAEAEPISRYLQTLALEKEQNLAQQLAKDLILIRLIDRFAASIVDFYSSFRPATQLPWNISHTLGGYLAAKKYNTPIENDFHFQFTIETGLVGEAFDSIYRRISDEQKAALQVLLKARLRLKKREIISAIEETLKFHPEVQAWGANS